MRVETLIQKRFFNKFLKLNQLNASNNVVIFYPVVARISVETSSI